MRPKDTGQSKLFKTLLEQPHLHFTCVDLSNKIFYILSQGWPLWGGLNFLFNINFPGLHSKGN